MKETDIVLQWCRVVWVEEDKDGERTFSDVIPTSWVDEGKKIVYWPDKSENTKKCLKQCKEPAKGRWLEFPLVKVKIKAGILVFYFLPTVHRQTHELNINCQEKLLKVALQS